MSTLEWKGHQVPWVTRWTGEIRRDKLEVSMTKNGVRIAYEDGGAEIRDQAGVLWQREGINRAGEPQFAHVSAFRQRTAMLKRICQVCGARITNNPIPWLMASNQLDFTDDGTAITMSPPTCSDCVPVALKLCPHLRKGDYLIVRVLKYSVWGVWGEGFVPKAEGREVARHKNILINYRHPDKNLDLAVGGILAKQQVVAFDKYTIEKEAM